MFEAVPSPFLASFDGDFRVGAAPTSPPVGAPAGKEARRALDDVRERLSDLQRILHAHDRHAVLLVFQGLDAAGKDSTIRAVFQGVNPAGCQVFSFKRPSTEELDHDFLWRTTCRLPERGRIGIFNRSHYEEVLVVRVHPAILEAQQLPDHVDREAIWRERFESIRDHERHLARNGTVVVKFFLNVSKEEQRRRFLARLDEPRKNWKFSPGDIEERDHWDAYHRAFEEALNATSRRWAPWYAIPADDKPFMRLAVAELVVATLESLDLRYPTVGAEDRARFEAMRDRLEHEP